MVCDGRSRSIEQFAHLVLGQPDGFLIWCDRYSERQIAACKKCQIHCSTSIFSFFGFTRGRRKGRKAPH